MVLSWVWQATGFIFAIKYAHVASAAGGGSSALHHLVLVGLFVSRDLSLQILHVTLEGAHQPQQALPLLLQVADVGASVVQLSLQTVQLLSHRRPTQDETGVVTSQVQGRKTQPHQEVSIHVLGPSTTLHHHVHLPYTEKSD